MNLLRVKGQHRGDAPDCAGRSERVADQRFGGADRDFVRARFKELPDRFGFNGVANRRRCGMRIDVIHLRRCKLGVCEGQPHGMGHFHTIFPWDHHMIGLAGGSVAGNLGIDFRLAFLRMRG